MKKFFYRLFGFSLGPILGAVISFIQVPVLTYFYRSMNTVMLGLFKPSCFNYQILSILGLTKPIPVNIIPAMIKDI